jgi:ABC-type bacteriocin/lantibiotic exporter with double-glycine peptidase domain
VTDQSGAGKAPHPKPARSNTIAIFMAATVLALVISVPAIVVSIVTYYILKMNLMLTLMASLVTLFVAMGFGYKLSGKLAKIQRTHNINEDANNKQ